jgi:SNF2 family DNA or RNA helicase
MTVKLFEFQREAVEKLQKVGSILIGDEMGLGKTVQAIALDLARRADFYNYKLKTLVICPLSMISTWTRWWLTMAPELRILPINNKDRSYFIDEALGDSYDVFICHWPSLRLMPELKEINWFHVIADEAHAMQNRKSKQTIALKALPAAYRSALTGTPAFDKPDDLWSILHWLYPKYWSSYWRYFDKHIIYTNYNGYRTIVGVANEDQLREEMAGFYIRRRKADVLKDLPDKYYSEISVDLAPQQRRAYDSMKKNMMAWIGEHEQEPVIAPIVIAQLTRLQQFAAAFGEYDEDSHKMRLSEPSTKLDAVIELIEDSSDQIVVFSQFAQMIKLLAQRLQRKGITCGIFTGSTPSSERGAIIENFQAGKIKVFAGTIAAGGVGITLTASSTVIFLDRAWSPSLNLQAEDRLHRIGQKSAVQVIDIIATDTIDAARIKHINLKWSWLKKLIGDDLTEDEINQMDYSSEDLDDLEFSLDD